MSYYRGEPKTARPELPNVNNDYFYCEDVSSIKPIQPTVGEYLRDNYSFNSCEYCGQSQPSSWQGGECTYCGAPVKPEPLWQNEPQEMVYSTTSFNDYEIGTIVEPDITYR